MKHLFNEFKPATAEDWKVRLEKDLKGITFDALSIKDRNDLTIRPFYTHADRAGTDAAVIANGSWSICERIAVEDAAAANREALHALGNGVSGLCFDILKDTDPAILLRDIELPYIYSCFNVERQPAFAAKLAAYCDSKGIDTRSIDCFIGNDLIAASLQSGLKPGITDAAALLSQTGQLCIEATRYQNAGASSVTELGYTVAQVNEYLALFENSGQLQQCGKLHISLAVGTDFYEQIAKLRALRKLLALLLAQYGITPSVHLHAETSNLYRAPFDRYSNLLRDTIAGMAAVMGGCDSLYIHPFDETLQQPGEFSRRMARNQQLIFKEESYLDKVADVAAGSYYIETLTDQLAEKAWEVFRETEAAGGLISALGKGSVKNTLHEQAGQLIADYKEGRRVLIGINKFPNAQDAPHPAPAKAQEQAGIQPVLLFQEIL